MDIWILGQTGIQSNYGYKQTHVLRKEEKSFNSIHLWQQKKEFCKDMNVKGTSYRPHPKDGGR